MRLRGVASRYLLISIYIQVADEEEAKRCEYGNNSRQFPYDNFQSPSFVSTCLLASEKLVGVRWLYGAQLCASAFTPSPLTHYIHGSRCPLSASSCLAALL